MKVAPFINRNRYLFAVIAVSAVIMLIIFGLFRIDNSTNLMIIEYLNDLGWQVEENPTEISHLTIPTDFDVVYQTYNAMQKASGFNLEDFKGKSVTRYSYRVLNHQSSATTEVAASIFVYGSTIIAGDISSVEDNGFMHSVTDTSYIN